MGTKATESGIAGFATRAHRLFEKFRDGALQWSEKEILDAIQDFSDNKVPKIFQPSCVCLGAPVLNDDGTVTVQVLVNYDKTIDEITAEITANYPSWRANEYIKAFQRIKLKGQAKKTGIHVVTLTLERIIPAGEHRQAPWITRTLGKPGLEFDLHVLVALIPFRDELWNLGVNWPIAWGAHFRDGGDRECVAVLDLESRDVRLWKDGYDWYGSNWFGYVCK